MQCPLHSKKKIYQQCPICIKVYIKKKFNYFIYLIISINIRIQYMVVTFGLYTRGKNADNMYCINYLKNVVYCE